MTGINDGKFEIKGNQGISWAIAEEIGLNSEQCKKVDWKSVFEIVKEAKETEGNNVNWEGGSDLSGSARNNFVVQDGQKIEFSANIWERIVDTVKNSLINKGIKTDNLQEPDFEGSGQVQPDENIPGTEDTPAVNNTDEGENTQSVGINLPEKTTDIPPQNVTPPRPRAFNKNLYLTPFLYNKNQEMILKDGRKVEFDKNGYVEHEYDKKGNRTRYIHRNKDGSIDFVADSEYDKKGNNTQTIYLNPDGSLNFFYYSEYDTDGKEIREVFYESDGSLDKFYCYIYDTDGKYLNVIRYNADGTEQ